MKQLLLTASVFLIGGSVNAQDSQAKPTQTPEFSLAANVGDGTSFGYKATYGVDAHVDYRIGLRTKATGSLGYQQFRIKYSSASLSGTLNFGAVPILAGIKYDLLSNLYTEGMLGYGIWTNDGDTGFGHFAYLARVGTKLNALDVAVQFLSVSDGDALSVRVGIGLGGRKK